MIAAWMLYTIAVTLILFGAANAAEYVGRALGVPTRLVWLVALVAAVGLPARALISGLYAPQRQETTQGTVSAPPRLDASGSGGMTARNFPTPPRRDRFQRLVIATRSMASTVAGFAARVDVTALDRWNRALVAVWVVSAFMALLWFAASLLRLRRIERTLTPATIDGQAVLLSENVGPALLGVVRSRIVLPRWVLTMPNGERHVILAHERQHVAAGDPALTYGAALLVAVQPWNVALWPLFARLRLALESDCDRRVLGKTGDARDYGRLLIATCARTMSSPSARVAFAEHRSHLERRIRRIARRPRLLSISAVTSAITATMFVTAACASTSPARRAAAPVFAKLPVGSAGATRNHNNVPLIVNEAMPRVRLSAVQRVTKLERCSFFAGAGGEWLLPNANDVPDTRPALRYAPSGCSIHGDVMVMALDSTHVVVSARDTAEAGLAVTDVIIFEVTSGTAVGSGWYESDARATLTDSVFTYASPRHPALAFRFYAGAAVRDRDASVVDVKNMVAIHSRFLTWDIIPQFPTAARCVPSPRSDHGQRACLLLRGTRRVEFPIL